MHLGIFSKVFERPSLPATLDAVTEYGFRAIQFNLEGAGGESLPAEIAPELVVRVRRAHEERGMEMAALSGTFNMIHPDPEERAEGLRRLKLLIAAAPDLGTPVVTLCTGTRDAENMWRRHPDNDSPSAWRDLLATLSEALPVAEANNVTLAFEPEQANVINSAVKGRRLLDEMGSRHLRVVMDGANLVPHDSLDCMAALLDEAFDLLGDAIVIAHAKDITDSGFVAAGKGQLDYDAYLRHLRQAHFDGALILHGLREDEVEWCSAFLRARLPA